MILDQVIADTYLPFAVLYPDDLIDHLESQLRFHVDRTLYEILLK